MKLITSLFFLIASINTAFAASIDWQSYSSDVFTQAKSEHRLVLLFGMASWCPWCSKMTSEVFTDSTVVNLVNKYYIPVMIDIDNEPDTAKRYNMYGVPTNIIMTGDYKILDTKMGYVNSSRMASFLSRNAH